VLPNRLTLTALKNCWESSNLIACLMVICLRSISLKPQFLFSHQLLIMKKILITLIAGCIGLSAFAQSFKEAVGKAQATYAGGNLEDAHFSLMQAMQELDMIIGKEVIKLLPAKLEERTANAPQDEVTSNIGFIGATIRRTYGTSPKLADLSIISNSPMIAMLNTVLNAPLLGGMMADANNKTVKVQGYKGRLTGSELSEGKKKYELQIPLGSALVTLSVEDCTEGQIMAMANTLPMQQIAKLVQ
jgi:hypothetical protein